MIIAGTVSAYLTLSITEFQTNLTTAMQLLERLGAAGLNSSGGISAVEGAAGRMAAAISGVMPGAFSVLTGGMTSIGTSSAAASTALSGLGGAASACAGAISTSFSSASDSAGKSASGLAASVASAAASVSFSGSNLAIMTATHSAAVSGAFSSAAMNAGAAGAGITTAMAGAAAGAATGMASVSASVSSLSSSQTTALNISKGICQNILTPIQALKGTSYTAMAAVGSGMVNGLRSMESAILGVARGIANRVRSTIENALEIASPSKVMRRIGAFTVEGMALGMEDLLPRVASSAAEVADTVRQASVTSLSAPVISSYAAGMTQSTSLPAAGEQESGYDLSSLSERMDQLIDYLYGTEPVLRLDGRTFGRMVREYV